MEQKLGRGLSALLEEADSMTITSSEVTANKVNIDSLCPNEGQPRKFFDEEKIDELANSISLHGVLQPIAVRKNGEQYEIIAGERRWRAAKIAGLREVPIHIIDCDDGAKIMALALIENLQRADLNPIEEAEAMRALMLKCDCRQEDLAVMLCKSRSYIGNALRLLSLPERVRELIRVGRLTAGHGRCLIGVQNAEEIAGIAAQENWNVRQLESTMKDLKSGHVSSSFGEIGARTAYTGSGTPIDPNMDPETMDIAIRVAEAIGVETKLKRTRRGGVFTLVCNSCEELEALVEKLISLGE
ncbi:MAG: ParB/RepB/Spo0J family partition protein [Holosporales bacterium]|jgi:ParB family chromosome partitioning protein|nr:ParB/RepB/Spo0J family partition protein [Holosporales bacterium]